MPTHPAIVTTAHHAPLSLIHVPTITPTGSEVRVRVEWTASTPLDMHQNDGGLLVKHPQILGDGTAGTVVEVGEGVKRLRVGDKVFGFTWREGREKAHQGFVTCPEWLLGKLPEGFTLQEAVTLPNNFVTVFHAVTADLSLPLPWPRPIHYVPDHADTAILIWGGSSSVGQFALQILKYYGYKNLIAAASTKHHDMLKSLGAASVFDYNDPEVGEKILAFARGDVPFILDCIGAQNGSVKPISEIARKGAKVAILLPIIVKDSTETEMPEYEMDVRNAADWMEGVDVRGVRTHFYLDNGLFKEKLQSEIMPFMLKEGIVKPNKQKIIEGGSMLERAQKAMNALRAKEASGERLVWRVTDEE